MNSMIKSKQGVSPKQVQKQFLNVKMTDEHTELK